MEKRDGYMDFTVAAEGGDNRGHDRGDGRLRPWMVMVVVQSCNAVSNLLFKKILNGGCYILPTLMYRNIIATLSVAPLAWLYEREAWNDLTSLTWIWILWYFLCFFVIALCQLTLALASFYYGMRETTAALSSNIMNSTPIMTFMIALITRRERVNFRSRTGRLKVLGALICIGGVILTMIKYPTEHPWYSTYSPLAASFSSAMGQSMQERWLGASSAKYSITTLMCLFGSFQTATDIFVNRHAGAWTLKLDIRLFTVFYSGVLNTAAAYFIISWVIPKRGYIYPSMFTSFSVIVAAVVECVMGEHTSLRSFVGMLIIIGGVHLHLWAKDYEEQAEHSCGSTHVPESRGISTCHSCGHTHRRICTCHSCGHRENVLESRELEDIPEQDDESASDCSLDSLDSDIVPDSHPRLPDSGTGVEESPREYGPGMFYSGAGRVFEDEIHPA